jgi:neutral ceramidase
MMRAIVCALALATSLLAGCGITLPRVESTPPAKHPRAPGSIRVGVARADLPMSPGASTFGHGPDSRVADGIWTRNYCRVFYFESSEGQQLAVVPCDLPAMSALLQRQVVDYLEDELPAKSPGKKLHASQLMMTATHTHAGIGHYFGAAQYTGIFSSRGPGFDEGLMRAMANRIADAVLVAMTNLRDVRLSWSHTSSFWCHTRNRSLAAYERNLAQFLPENPPACTRGQRHLEAIDPALDVLRIDAYDARTNEVLGPLGSLSFFAMHPTVVHNDNQLFGGDVSGVVSRQIEARLRREWCAKRVAPGAFCELPEDPLAGVINTNEGDISPVWVKGDIEEAIDVGMRVASDVWRAHPCRVVPEPDEPPPPETKPPPCGDDRVVIDSRYVEEDIRNVSFSDGSQQYSTCCFGQIGVGVARGGSDHPTSFAPLAWFSRDPAADYESTSCHAPKLPLLGPLSLTTRRDGAFPSDLPLAVARIGDTVIPFVPAELTITAGHRLKQRIAAAIGSGEGIPQHVVLAGLANEYIQYVTTEEEYELQAYEGASTLYGKNTSRYLNDRYALIARALFDDSAEQALRELDLEPGRAGELDFGFGRSVSTLIEDSDDYTPRLHGLCRMAPEEKRYPPRLCMYWSDRGPSRIGVATPPWVRVVDSAPGSNDVRLCKPNHRGICDSLGFVDDRGTELITRVHEKIGVGWMWSTLFSPAPETWEELSKRSVRLQVTSVPAIASEPFSGASLPPVCSIQQARLCTPGAMTEEWGTLVAGE